MRKFVLFLPLVAFIVLGGFLWKGLQLDPTELPSALLDKPFPEFQLVSLSGDAMSREALIGEVALVNVWATWCPSCKDEHAMLNKIAAEGYQIIGINYKDDPEQARLWLKRYLNPYHQVVVDEKGSLGLDLGVYGAPETYVIDAKGVIRYKHVGVVDESVWRQLKVLMDQLKAEV